MNWLIQRKMVKNRMSRRFSIPAHSVAMKCLAWLFLLAAGCGLTGCASNQAAVPPQANTAAPATALPVTVDPMVAARAERAEQIRTGCIANRRLICGRVLEVATNGLVVDSGYTDLLRPPLGQSWVIPGSASASRDPHRLELNQPASPCIGLVFLTDVPRRPKPGKYDFVVLIGYPAGEYTYQPLPGVEKPIRKFAGGLATAVKLQLQAEKKNSTAGNPSHKGTNAKF
jgi:hypothetical protein